MKPCNSVCKSQGGEDHHKFKACLVYIVSWGPAQSGTLSPHKHVIVVCEQVKAGTREGKACEWAVKKKGGPRVFERREGRRRRRKKNRDGGGEGQPRSV